MIKPLKKMIHLIFLYLCVWCLVGVFSVDEVKPESVLEGKSVTLNPDLTEKWKNEEIEWRFGLKDILIAQINRQNNKDKFYDGSADGRFRGRLKLDHQTGSLTITNTRTTDSGLYKVFNTKTDTLLSTFSLTVYAHLSVPVINKYSPQCSSSSSSSSSVSKCVLLCSAVNVSHVTLSWYKEKSLLSSISASDLSISLSLPLEVEHQDRNTYSCVLNNPFSFHSEEADISHLCWSCSESRCCGFTEAVIRLVLSALVGVAGAVFLVYDIRSRSLHQEKIVKNASTNTDQPDVDVLK